MPAEWEAHEATWMTWPKDPVTWPERLPQAQEAFAQMIEALTPGEAVHLLVDDAEAEAQARVKIFTKRVNAANLFFHHVPTADSWIRDYGPNFLLREGEERQAFNGWRFNAWGEKYESLLSDDGIPQRLASRLNLPMFEPNIVLEGGSIDVNGQGLVLTTEQCLLNPNRNPKLGRKRIETYLKNYLNVQKILWLGEGIAGDDTDGHIDDIARFVAPDTVMAAVEEDPADPNYRPLQENLKKLRSFTDLKGRNLRVLTLPMPGRLETPEGPLPASYANFYIANGVVLLPIFAHSNDAKAVAALQQVFPHRKIIGVDCRDLVWGMGAIHCLTQQQPK
ncbi:MAG TPA: agmatine deiminase [Deltaproteobacteria bacterium]|nr:agmatine deiminase [Deltaproteobacteria bacterium]